jgi:uncharacterized protein
VPRPLCCRRVEGKPIVSVFKPAGIPNCELDVVVITLDEFEAVRLADLEGEYQEQAADRMKVSRPTFSRIIESAHRKIAEVLISGKALKIEGGTVDTGQRNAFRCPRCKRKWKGPAECPRCCDGGSGNQGPEAAQVENGRPCRHRRRRRTKHDPGSTRTRGKRRSK